MNPSKTCSNCGGKDIYSHAVRAKGLVDLLPIGFFSGGEFELRVCGECGLANWYVPDKYLAKVKKNFKRQ
jgi:hypothetical protein